MTTFDQRMQQTAFTLIQKRGKTVTYTAVAPNTYDPTVAGAVASTVVSTIKAIVSNAGGQDLVGGTLIEKNDKNMQVAAMSLAVAPMPNDIVKLDGETYLVTSANPTYAGELPAVYDIKARKA